MSDWYWHYRTPRWKRWRLYGAWCLLRGRQVAYRIRVDNGTVMLKPGVGWIKECSVTNAPGAGFQIDSGNKLI